MIDNYFIKDNCLFCKRTVENSSTEGILFFNTALPTMRSFLKYLDNMKCDRYFVYTKSKFHMIYSYILNCMVNQNFGEKLSEPQSYPTFDLTRNPQTLPVTFKEDQEWSTVDTKSILPFHGWDFYETSWILQRWESSLGAFDYDEFMIIPSYPKDIYNNLVPPNIVFFVIDSYLTQHSRHDLEINYFALSLFYKDDFGKSMLSFYYDELQNPSKDKLTIFKRIHSLYHNHNSTHHPYRLFLFYENYAISTNGKFKITNFILQYISFYSMFVCTQFLMDRKQNLKKGIESRHFYLLPFLKEDTLITDLNSLHSMYEKPLTWIGKNHISMQIQNKVEFWKFIHINWDHIDRNINLWDTKLIYYADSQKHCGGSTLNYFPRAWIKSFHDPNYVAKPIPPKLKRKL